MKRMNRWTVLSLLLLAGTGCGPEVVGGGEHGDVRTTMNDEPGSGEAAQSRAGGPAMSLSGSGPVAGQVIDLDGSVTAEVEAELITAAGGTIDLTQGSVARTVEIGSAGRVQLGFTEDIDVGVYPRVRLTFTRVEATLAAGSPLPVSIEVDLGGTPLVLEVPVEVVVLDDENNEVVTEVNVDLNAAVWLALADPVTVLVARGVFASAIAVTAQEGVER